MRREDEGDEKDKHAEEKDAEEGEDRGKVSGDEEREEEEEGGRVRGGAGAGLLAVLTRPRIPRGPASCPRRLEGGGGHAGTTAVPSLCCGGKRRIRGRRSDSDCWKSFEKKVGRELSASHIFERS